MEQDAMQGIMGLGQTQPMMAQGPRPTMQNPIPEVNADQLAAFDRARQEISPQEFSEEILRAGAEVDPQAVAELRQDLMAAQLPTELVLAMLTMVEALLAEPGRYAEIRQELLAEGVPEDLLPEQFDGEFFGALELALEQMMAMSQQQTVQNFAQGGLASLKPIAKELQSYGRNGDTMLAHITPQEARMLQRMGGSGTINPVTGLREYWGPIKAIGNAFKSVGKAVTGAVKSVVNGVKKFVKSPVGKIVTAAALAFFVGPAAASMIGVGSTAGVAAVSGFVGGFGSSIIGGDNFKTALRNGAIGGVVAGAGAGIIGGAEAFQAGSYTGPTTVSGQWDRLKSGVSSLFGSAPTGAEALPVDMSGPIQGTALPPLETPTVGATSATGAPVGAAPTATTGASLSPTSTAPISTSTTAVPGMQTVGQVGTGGGGGGGSSPGLFDRIGNFFTGNSAAPTTPGMTPQIQAGMDAVKALPAGTPSYVQQAAFDAAVQKATPSAFSTYAPYVAGGLGIMALTGGFNEQQPETPNLYEQMRAEINPEDYKVNLGPVVTTYNTPAGAQEGYQPYADFYASMAQNPFLPQQQVRMAAAGGPANPADFPRRNGAINGPGTETSDDIPAMLSDGEFVMTARAVRGAGNGSRRAGAKRMYQMMKQFERNT